MFYNKIYAILVRTTSNNYLRPCRETHGHRQEQHHYVLKLAPFFCPDGALDRNPCKYVCITMTVCMSLDRSIQQFTICCEGYSFTTIAC